jgi:hypothetical protein
MDNIPGKYLNEEQLNQVADFMALLQFRENLVKNKINVDNLAQQLNYLD